jgi:hypothetical protein
LEHPAHHLPLAALDFAALETIAVQYLAKFGKVCLWKVKGGVGVGV